MDYGPSTIAPIVRYSRIVRMIGLDLGERRIGIAVSDPSATLARPLKTIERRGSDETAIAQVRAVIAELEEDEPVAGIVVGLPRKLDGSPTGQTVRAQKMIDLLAQQLRIPVFAQDERLSSREAEQRLALREKDWRKRKAKLDAASAAVILQDYLDARRAEEQKSEESTESGESKESKESGESK